MEIITILPFVHTLSRSSLSLSWCERQSDSVVQRKDTVLGTSTMKRAQTGPGSGSGPAGVGGQAGVNKQAIKGVCR